jgi:hypothetical protein
MTKIDMDLFDEAIELTKQSVDAQIAAIGAQRVDLPGEVIAETVTTSAEPEAAEPIAIVTTVEPTTEPPAETTTKPITEPDGDAPTVHTPEAKEELQRLRDEAQADYEQRLAEATEVYTDASIVVMEITKDLKEAKRKMKEALDEFFHLKTSGPQLPTAIPLAGSKKSSPPKSKSSDVKPLDSDLEKLVESDTTWREIPIAEVLSGVSGLGVKKYDALAGAFANLGELEDARGQASREFKEFKEFLPDGIGPSLTDKLQERIGDVMRNHFAKVREKIAVANEAGKATAETAAVPKQDDAPKADAPKPEKAGITVSVDDALLDDSDLI